MVGSLIHGRKPGGSGGSQNLQQVLTVGNNAGGLKITGIADATAPTDAVNLETLIAGLAQETLEQVLLNGNDGGGNRITNISDAISPTDAVTLEQLSQLLPKVVAFEDIPDNTDTVTVLTYTNTDTQPHTYVVNAYLNQTANSAASTTVDCAFGDENAEPQDFPLTNYGGGTEQPEIDYYPFAPLVIRVGPDEEIVITATLSGGTVSFDVGATIMQLD